MWRRIYLLLVLVRLWFALSSSYLHPDENFQGPEVIAGMYAPAGLGLLSYLAYVLSFANTNLRANRQVKFSSTPSD